MWQMSQCLAGAGVSQRSQRMTSWRLCIGSSMVRLVGNCCYRRWKIKKEYVHLTQFSRQLLWGKDHIYTSSKVTIYMCISKHWTFWITACWPNFVNRGNVKLISVFIIEFKKFTWFVYNRFNLLQVILAYVHTLPQSVIAATGVYTSWSGYLE